jgi:polyisoprenoid-binding protein YceI
MNKFFIAFLSLLLLNASALAAELDPQESSVTWKGSKITGDFHDGQISIKSSSLKLSRGALVSGKIMFDLNSITVGNLEGEWKDKFLGHMKSPDFFDVGKFPTATLNIETFKNGEMTGELTIKGVTQPISIPTKRVAGKYVGKATFDRTKFGITYGSGSFFKNLGDKLINDTVEIEFSIALLAN